MSTPDGYIVEGHVEDGLWAVLTAHRERAAAEAWIDDWPHWRAAGARIRPFRYTDAPVSGEPSGAEAVVREAPPISDTAIRALDAAFEHFTRQYLEHLDAGRAELAGIYDVRRSALNEVARALGLKLTIDTAPGAPEEGAGE